MSAIFVIRPIQTVVTVFKTSYSFVPFGNGVSHIIFEKSANIKERELSMNAMSGWDTFNLKGPLKINNVGKMLNLSFQDTF